MMAGGAKARKEEMGRMAKVAQVIRREFVEILPVTIFFLISFQLIAFTKHLVLAREGIVYEGFIAATVGSLVIAKVVLVVDKLPIMRLYRGRPLYRPILYRTFFYGLCVLVVRLLEILVRNWIQKGDFVSGMEAARAEVVWAQFAFVQIWIFVLFLVYVTWVELRDEFGIGAVRKALFSRHKE